MCNAWNHPPGCNCGFGGGDNGYTSTFDSYARYFMSSRLLESEVFRIPQTTSEQEEKTFPTHCPWCGAEVFYHTNGNGDSVYFDRLGKPWEIHACFSEYWKQEKERRKLLGSLPASQHFLSPEIHEREKDKRLLLGAIRGIAEPLTEEAIAQKMGLNKRELRKYYGSFYKPKGYSESDWDLAVSRAIAGKGNDITTEVSLDFREAIFGCEKVVRIYSDLEQKYKKLKITIPPGVSSQTRLRVAGEGELSISDEIPGDLYIHLEVEMEEDDFTRQDTDIVSTIEVLPDQALNGEKVKLNTLDGEVYITLPRRTRSGQKLRLKGYGVPILKVPDERGDHIVCVVFE